MRRDNLLISQPLFLTNRISSTSSKTKNLAFSDSEYNLNQHFFHNNINSHFSKKKKTERKKKHQSIQKDKQTLPLTLTSYKNHHQQLLSSKSKTPHPSSPPQKKSLKLSSSTKVLSPSSSSPLSNLKLTKAHNTAFNTPSIQSPPIPFNHKKTHKITSSKVKYLSFLTSEKVTLCGLRNREKKGWGRLN